MSGASSKKRLLKDSDKYNYHNCRYTGKAIRMGESFYSEMVPRASGHGWRRSWAVKASKAEQMIAAGEAELVTWADLGEEPR